MTSNKDCEDQNTPQRLKRLLRLINLVSTHTPLPKSPIILGNCYFKRTDCALTSDIVKKLPKEEDYLDALIETWGIIKYWLTERTESFLLFNYIVRDTDQNDLTNAEYWLETYDMFFEFRLAVRYIAEKTDQFSKKSQGLSLPEDSSRNYPWEPPEFSSLFEITDEGRITFQNNKIIKALEGLDARRLRICPICGLVFWANRLDKKACSITCGQTLRTRRKREREKNRFQARNNKDGTLQTPKLEILVDEIPF